MTAPDLLPCPFCGTDKVAVCQSERTNPVFWVECIRCNAEAQPSTDKAEAIAAWNTRATPAPAAMTPEVAKLVEAAWQMLIEYDEANIEPEPRSMTSAAIRLRAALAALRAGGDA